MGSRKVIKPEQVEELKRIITEMNPDEREQVVAYLKMLKMKREKRRNGNDR